MLPSLTKLIATKQLPIDRRLNADDYGYDHAWATDVLDRTPPKTFTQSDFVERYPDVMRTGKVHTSSRIDDGKPLYFKYHCIAVIERQLVRLGLNQKDAHCVTIVEEPVEWLNTYGKQLLQRYPTVFGMRILTATVLEAIQDMFCGMNTKHENMRTSTDIDAVYSSNAHRMTLVECIRGYTNDMLRRLMWFCWYEGGAWHNSHAWHNFQDPATAQEHLYAIDTWKWTHDYLITLATTDLNVCHTPVYDYFNVNVTDAIS